MREWWRWTLRGIAVLGLLAGGILLALHPSATAQVPAPVQVVRATVAACSGSTNDPRAHR